MTHDPVPFYRGQSTPNRSNHHTGAIPYCRVCRQTLTPGVAAKPCPGTPVRYVVHPGNVTSRNDGDRHYISAPVLARLYGVQRYVVAGERGFRPEPGDIHLHPRFDGNYELPQKGA